MSPANALQAALLGGEPLYSKKRPVRALTSELIDHSRLALMTLGTAGRGGMNVSIRTKTAPNCDTGGATPPICPAGSAVWRGSPRGHRALGQPKAPGPLKGPRRRTATALASLVDGAASVRGRSGRALGWRAYQAKRSRPLIAQRPW